MNSIFHSHIQLNQAPGLVHNNSNKKHQQENKTEQPTTTEYSLNEHWSQISYADTEQSRKASSWAEVTS